MPRSCIDQYDPFEGAAGINPLRIKVCMQHIIAHAHIAMLPSKLSTQKATIKLTIAVFLRISPSMTSNQPAWLSPYHAP